MGDIVKPGADDQGRRPYSFTISDYVFSLGLTPFAFALYGHLKMQYDNGSGDEMPPVKALAAKLPMSVGAVVKARDELVRAGLLVESLGISPDDAVELLRSKQPQKFHGEYVGRLYLCEWCEATTPVPQAHHFPIPKSEGGTQTVSICANCHSEYHRLVRSAFVLRGEL